MNLVPKSLIKVIADAENKPIIAQITAGTVSIPQALVGLSKYYPIRLWFSEPATLQCPRHWVRESDNRKAYITHKTGDTLTVNKFFLHGDTLCYASKKTSRTGYYFDMLDKVVKYDIVLGNATKDAFSTFEQFKGRFDLMFITEDEILKLWNGTSSQHGGKYTPRDFHGMGPRGKQVMNDFLRRFKGVKDTPRGIYDEKGYMRADYRSYHHSGRDISISHLFGNSYVWYSSEFSGCGNGRYGLVANKSTFLWLEDD